MALQKEEAMHLFRLESVNIVDCRLAELLLGELQLHY